MKRLFTIFFIAISISAVSKNKYTVNIFSERIKTLIIHEEKEWDKEPVLSLNGDNKIKISFDELSHNYIKFSYRIIHCNCDWTKSELSPVEYIDGFYEYEIENYEQSNNTYTNYTHYKFNIPNENTQIKCSGNYAIEIFNTEKPDKILATACFMAVDNKTTINAKITADTDIDFKKKHQQLEISVIPYGIRQLKPLTEIKTIVKQNRKETGKTNILIPKNISGQELIYKNDKKLIFNAGNEYRRFEITSTYSMGMNVYEMEYSDPYYNAELYKDKERKIYIYDKDQDGRRFIRTTDYDYSDYQADYFLVHFSMPYSMPEYDGAFYINGDLVYNKTDNASKMIYNFKTREYEKTLLLKQGSYNYQYIFIKSGEDQGTSEKTEGSFWQTENEYSIYVYYRPTGGRYDRLIGYKLIKSDF